MYVFNVRHRFKAIIKDRMIFIFSVLVKTLYKIICRFIFHIFVEKLTGNLFIETFSFKLSRNHVRLFGK